MENLPEIDFEPGDYRFITLFTYRKRNVFVSEKVNSVITDTLTFHINRGNIRLAAYMVMPTHVHLIVAEGKWDIPVFVNNFKSYTGKKIKDTTQFEKKVWRRRFYDYPIFHLDEFNERLTVMHNDPVKKQLVENAMDFKWSSYADYNGIKGSVPILVAPLEALYERREKMRHSPHLFT